jgi:hypothetical protein
MSIDPTLLRWQQQPGEVLLYEPTEAPMPAQRDAAIAQSIAEGLRTVGEAIRHAWAHQEGDAASPDGA